MSSDRPLDDLVKCVRAGDPDAASELIRRYESAIRRAIRFRMRDTRLNAAFDSMDICQSVMASFFVRAASGQFELDTAEGILQLLAGMAKKKLAMQIRRQQTQRRDYRRVAGEPVEEVPLAGNSPSPSRHVAAKELLNEVHRLLNDEERQIAQWRQVGVEWAEIALRLNSTSDAIRKKFTRAIDRIAIRLGIDEEEADAEQD